MRAEFERMAGARARVGAKPLALGMPIGMILPLFFVVLSPGGRQRFYIDSRASVLRIPLADIAQGRV